MTRPMMRIALMSSATSKAEKRNGSFFMGILRYGKISFSRSTGASLSRAAPFCTYQSHASQGNLLQLIQEHRGKDRIMGYSLKGVHKDDLVMQIGEYPIKREGSQGQNKTYLIALKLAQFDFLRRTGSNTTPLLLLDDIFDKLDASRVEQIVKLVAGDKFGQIFITDTNREHLDKIMQKIEGDYKVFSVENGRIQERKGEEA